MTITTDKIVRKTIDQLAYLYDSAKEKRFNPNDAYHQAFGMISLASVLVDYETYDKLAELWSEYAPKFETLIYGE